MSKEEAGAYRATFEKVETNEPLTAEEATLLNGFVSFLEERRKREQRSASLKPGEFLVGGHRRFD